MITTITKFIAIAICSSALMACSSKPVKVEPVIAAAKPVTPAPVQFTTTKRGPMLTLEDVLFDFEADTLRPEANSLINQAAIFLKDNPDRVAVVEGHTDHTGDEDYNQMLSEARSQAVMSALETHGIDDSQIRVIGFGESRPKVSNDTFEGRQANRRVEIVFQQAAARFSSL